jgi:hypothetical protein
MVRKGENMSDKNDKPLTGDDIDWIDAPFAEEGLEVAGVMLAIIKEMGMVAHTSREDLLEVFDAADVCREVLHRVLTNAVRNEEVAQLEEIWELN